MNMSDRFFQHTDGGLYRFVNYARSADTGGNLVVYEHVWPFEPGIWVRDRAEFEARFAQIDAAAVQERMRGDRAFAQAAVSSAKAARRAKKAP